jgi:hypothetical protein
VLGELERRMNSPGRLPDVHDLASFSSNGHGSVERLAATGPSVS